MPALTAIENFAQSNASFQKVLAGKITVEDFFVKTSYAADKAAFMNIFKEEMSALSAVTFFSEENIAASWITNLRYNALVDKDTFIQYINRAQAIFQGDFRNLQLNTADPKDNDICAIMWGIEALNGIQSFDSGSTRVRLPPRVAQHIIAELENGGAIARSNTHGTGTKLTDKGLGKDIPQETMRLYTPRGMGALLVVPTSPNGTGTLKTSSLSLSASASPSTSVKTATKQISHLITMEDYDLLLKREDYGYNDTITHSMVHSKVGFLNYLRKHSDEYREGKVYINQKSPLALQAENQQGKGKNIHRKEHLSELKNQAKSAVQLLEAGKKMGLFPDFTIKWAIRIKWPPFEKKIVSANTNKRQGIGEFFHQVQIARHRDSKFATNNQKELSILEPLINQTLLYDNSLGDNSLEKCREGNEVLVNCISGKAVLVEAIAKASDHSPTNRAELGTLVTAVPEEKSAQNSFKQKLQAIKEPPASASSEFKTEDVFNIAHK